mmetsp:Transcript_21326/g.29626  ORF Transcript_21326/g.29626 Transcript_21326/m.29626 type:complete len:105 (+) Transcript_21326:71-385(+)
MPPPLLRYGRGYSVAGGGETRIFRGDDVCANPDGDSGGSWCFTQQGSCPRGARPAGPAYYPGDDQWDYCTKSTSLNFNSGIVLLFLFFFSQMYCMRKLNFLDVF